MNPVVAGKRRKGFTLIELLVAISLMMILISAVMVIFSQATEVFRRIDSSSQIMQNARVGVEHIADALSTALPSSNPNQHFWMMNAFTNSPEVANSCDSILGCHFNQGDIMFFYGTTFVNGKRKTGYLMYRLGDYDAESDSYRLKVYVFTMDNLRPQQPGDASTPRDDTTPLVVREVKTTPPDDPTDIEDTVYNPANDPTPTVFLLEEELCQFVRAMRIKYKYQDRQPAGVTCFPDFVNIVDDDEDNESSLTNNPLDIIPTGQLPPSTAISPVLVKAQNQAYRRILSFNRLKLPAGATYPDYYSAGFEDFVIEGVRKFTGAPLGEAAFAFPEQPILGRFDDVATNLDQGFYTRWIMRSEPTATDYASFRNHEDADLPSYDFNPLPSGYDPYSAGPPNTERNASMTLVRFKTRFLLKDTDGDSEWDAIPVLPENVSVMTGSHKVWVTQSDGSTVQVPAHIVSNGVESYIYLIKPLPQSVEVVLRIVDQKRGDTRMIPKVVHLRTSG